MTWTIDIHRSVEKNIRTLPPKIQDAFALLLRDLKEIGPVQPRWKHFSKLGKTTYHCHIGGGKPTYVACWEVLDKKIKLIEVYYAGTHEKAPY